MANDNSSSVRILDAVLAATLVAGVAGGGWYLYTQQPDGDDPGEEVYMPPTDEIQTENCTRIAGEQADRLAACLDELSNPLNLSNAANKQIKDFVSAGGKSLKVATLGNFKVDATVVTPKDDPKMMELVLGEDEGAVAKHLRDQDVRMVVVHRDIAGAIDRDKVALARMIYRDHLEWFQLRRVTKDAFVYSVRSSPSTIQTATGDEMLRGLRARLEGKTVLKQKWQPSVVRLIGSVRMQGETLAMRHAIGNNVDQVLNELAAKIQRRWEREVEPMGLGRLEDRLDDVRFEIHVVMEKADVEPRDRRTLFQIWEMGVDGMMLKLTKPRNGQDLFTYNPGSELVTHSWKSADQFLQESAKKGGWRDRRPWEGGDTDLDMIRTQHFMESKLGGGPGVKLVRGVPEVTMAQMTDSHIRDMLVRGGEWWLHNSKPSGLIEYKYWPTQNRRSEDYNEVRHVLGARDLADVWRYRNDDRYLAGSKANMDWLMKYVVYDHDKPHAQLPHPPKNSLLFRYPFRDGEVRGKPPNQKLGTVAVALLGWVAWADATGSKAQDDNIRRMAEFTKFRLLDNGKFDPYYVHRSHNYYGEKNDIVPGEAALALGMVAEYFGEPEWVDFYPKFLKFYQPWFRERSIKKNKYGRWPHATYSNTDRLDMVQFGPWSVMAAKQFYKVSRGTEMEEIGNEAGDFGLEVADWMIDNYQWTSARSPWPDYVGGYYKLPNETPAMQSFCYSEGTAAAYTLASRFRPDGKKKYELATQETIRFLEVMQYDDLDSYFVARPDMVYGGVKYTMNENKVRTDYVGHGLSTLSQFLDARVYDPATELQAPDPTVVNDGSKTLPSLFDPKSPDPAAP